MNMINSYCETIQNALKSDENIYREFFRMCDEEIWFTVFKKTVKENYLNTGIIELTDMQFEKCYEIATKKTIDDSIDRLCKRGLLEETDNKELKLTNKGLFFGKHLKNKN
jgi:hypothetical protein